MWTNWNSYNRRICNKDSRFWKLFNVDFVSLSLVFKLCLLLWIFIIWTIRRRKCVIFRAHWIDWFNIRHDRRIFSILFGGFLPRFFAPGDVEFFLLFFGFFFDFFDFLVFLLLFPPLTSIGELFRFWWWRLSFVLRCLAGLFYWRWFSCKFFQQFSSTYFVCTRYWSSCVSSSSGSGRAASLSTIGRSVSLFPVPLSRQFLAICPMALHL